MIVEKNMKIGIMGGTFNPIHTGHLLLAEYAMDACKLDKIIFIPTGNPYMKDQKEILNGKERLTMVELAIEGVEGFESSDIEIVRDGNTYTCDTLLALSKQYPSAKLFFLTGADSFLSLHKWKNPDKILELSTVVVVTRDGATLDTLETQKKALLASFGGEVQIVDFPTVDISSTDIRTRIKNGKSIRFQVPENVRRYITENNLYGNREGNI